MTTFGFRWYGPEDAVTLEHIRQIPPVTELVTSLYHIPAGALWPEEDIAARAARVMQGAVLYFGAAYARFLELPMWITWGLVGFCLAWGLLEWGLTLWYRHRM